MVYVGSNPTCPSNNKNMSKTHLLKILDLLNSNDEEALRLGMQLLKEHKNEFGKKAKYLCEDKYMPIRSFPFKKVITIFGSVYTEGYVSGRFKNLKLWTINLEDLANAIHYQERMEENASEQGS